jgi:hypothetical protein
LVAVLCTSIAFSGGGIYFFTESRAIAANDPKTPVDLDKLMSEDFAKAQELDQQWGRLDELPAGQPRGSIAADRFLLMEQTVLPKELPVVSRFGGQVLRLHKLVVLIQRVDRYLKLIDEGKAEARTFEDLDPKDIPALTKDQTDKEIMAHIAAGRKADTPYFVWQRRLDKEHLLNIRRHMVTMFNTWQRDRAMDVANYTQADTSRRVRAVNWWDVNVSVTEADGPVLRVLPMSDTARYRSLSGKAPYFCAEDVCQFNLTYKNETLHKFGIPAKVVATYGQFLIFTHKDSYDAPTGTQYLSFIDLETYSTAIGNEDLPVFRMPVKTDKPISSLEIRGGKLILNGTHWLDKDVLQDASDLQQMAFNLTSNLVDPREWASTLPMVDAFREQVRRIMEHTVADAASEYGGLKKTEVLFGQLGKELQSQLEKTAAIKPSNPSVSEENLKDAGKDGKFETALKAVQTYHDRVKQSGVLADRMEKVTTKVADSRKLSGRISMLMAKLLSPKPWASQKLKEAIGIYVAKRGDLLPSQRGFIGNFMDRPFLNSGVIAATAMSIFMPDSFHQLVGMGLGVGSSVLDYMMFALKGIGESVLVGTDRTFAALYEPVKAIGDQYIYNGNWYRTLIGLAAFVPTIFSIYYLSHWAFNFHKYKEDLRAGKAKNFIEQQSLAKYEALKRQADEDAKKHTGEVANLSGEDKAGIDQWLKDRAAGKHSPPKKYGWFSRHILGKKGAPEEMVSEEKMIGETAINERVGEALAAGEAAAESEAVKDVSRLETGEFKSFWAAAKHFAFTGMASYETTLHRWASFWNFYAGWRFCSVGFKGVRVCKTNIPLMISPKPVMWSARLLFPDLFSTVVAKRNGKLVIPTQINGGLRKRALHDFVGIFSKRAAEAARAKLQGTTTEQIRNLSRFEDKIIDVENEIVKVAFNESLGALAKFATNKKDLEIIFGADPITSITNSQIRDLSFASQTFLRAHFESIYDRAMHKYMEGLVDAEGAEPPISIGDLDKIEEAAMNEQRAISESGGGLKGETGGASLAELKKAFVAKTTVGADHKFDLERAKGIVKEVADDGAHRIVALEAVRKGRLSVSNIARNTKYNAVSNLDPEQNPSMARWNVVHTRLQSPGALGRAVRAEISKLLVTFPLDLGMKMFLAAGITEGVLKPIQEEFWGPNSTAYLSHTSFYMLMASGFAMGMMADAWVKVQMDQRQDDMGEFGQIPKGEDAVRGLTRWWTKNFFAPANSLWSNYMFYNKVIFWNLPAALFNISLFYYAFSGRIDLSLLIAGYVVAFGTPLGAFHQKLDQAFERAVHYAARGLKKELWLGDPRVQEVMLKEQQRMRNRYTFWHDFFSGIEGNWTTAIEMIPTSYGTRGFARALFGGKLIEEMIVDGVLDPAKAAVANVPGVGPAVNAVAAACEHLLTYGNEDLTLRKGK